jgi:hypothetical protein
MTMVLHFFQKLGLKAREAIYGYGIRWRLPFALVKRMLNICDGIFRPINWLHRHYYAAKILKDSKWADFFSKKKGYRQIKPGELAFLNPLVRVGKEIYASRREGFSHKEGYHYAEFLRPEDFKKYPELLNGALDANMLEIVSGYFGAIPRLHDIQLWVSKPSSDVEERECIINGKKYAKGEKSTFHIDKMENGLVYLFLLISDVTEENGPFVFVPRDVSDQIRKDVDFEYNLLFGSGPLSAEQEKKYITDNALAVVGAPGTGIFVDVLNCFHAPSRCVEGERAMLVVRYIASKPELNGEKHFGDGAIDTSGIKGINPEDSLSRLIL